MEATGFFRAGGWCGGVPVPLEERTAVLSRGSAAEVGSTMPLVRRNQTHGSFVNSY